MTSNLDPTRPAPTGATAKLWGGRFREPPSAALEAISLSVHFDWRLAPYDLDQTAAHAGVLHAAGLLTDEELAAVREAIDGMRADIESGAYRPLEADEDVHTAVEGRLIILPNVNPAAAQCSSYASIA